MSDKTAALAVVSLLLLAPFAAADPQTLVCVYAPPDPWGSALEYKCDPNGQHVFDRYPEVEQVIVDSWIASGEGGGRIVRLALSTEDHPGTISVFSTDGYKRLSGEQWIASPGSAMVHEFALSAPEGEHLAVVVSWKQDGVDVWRMLRLYPDIRGLPGKPWHYAWDESKTDAYAWWAAAGSPAPFSRVP